MSAASEFFIFWLMDDGHIEVPGIYLHGYWSSALIPKTAFDLADCWKAVASEISFQKIGAEQGNFLVASVWVKSWPDDPTWRSVIEATLEKMVEAGAQVAWCGDEYTSWSLAELNPSTYGGRVYAAASPTQRPIMHSDLFSDPLVFLSESEISRLGIGKPAPRCKYGETRANIDKLIN